MEFWPIVWEEWLTWKKRFWLYLATYMMSPLLFLITFGWGSGNKDYLHFLLPGIVAFSALLNCYTGVMTRIVSSKTLLHTMDYYIQAPIRSWNMIFGFMVAGALRGFFAVLLILFAGYLLNVPLVLSLGFFISVFLVCLAFSALGLVVGFWADNFQSTHLFSDVFVLPMSFLGGTFVALERLPNFLQYIAWCLPLTPCSLLLRSLAFGEGMRWGCFGMLLAWLAIFALLARFMLRQAIKD